MISDFLPQIDLAKCIGCDLCVKACPTHTLAMVNDLATVIHPEACDYTGACQEICPTQAISLTYEIVFMTTQGREHSQNQANEPTIPKL